MKGAVDVSFLPENVRDKAIRLEKVLQEIDKSYELFGNKSQDSFPSMGKEAEFLEELLGKTRKQVKEAEYLYNSVCKGIGRIDLKCLNNEALLQKKYCDSLLKNGVAFKEQVSVPNGRIDVLTDKVLIEMKNDSNDSTVYQAIGQLSYYSKFYPHHSLRLVVPVGVSPQMENILKKLNIKLEVFNE